MFVEKWMTPDPVTVPPTMTISAAALEMSRHKFRHLLVAEPSSAGKKLLGILSKYDIGRAFPEHHNPFSPEVTATTVAKPVSAIMVRNVITVEPSCALEEAARILRTRHINALPVARNGHLLGIITESDMFDAILDMTGANSQGIKLEVESDDVASTLLNVSQLTERFHLNLLDAMSFRVPRSNNKVISTFHFSSRPNEQFVQDLCKHGVRVCKIG